MDFPLRTKQDLEIDSCFPSTCKISMSSFCFLRVSSSSRILLSFSSSTLLQSKLFILSLLQIKCTSIQNLWVTLQATTPRLHHNHVLSTGISLYSIIIDIQVVFSEASIKHLWRIYYSCKSWKPREGWISTADLPELGGWASSGGRSRIGFVAL